MPVRAWYANSGGLCLDMCIDICIGMRISECLHGPRVQTVAAWPLCLYTCLCPCQDTCLYTCAAMASTLLWRQGNPSRLQACTPQYEDISYGHVSRYVWRHELSSMPTLLWRQHCVVQITDTTSGARHTRNRPCQDALSGMAVIDIHRYVCRQLCGHVRLDIAQT